MFHLWTANNRENRWAIVTSHTQDPKKGTEPLRQLFSKRTPAPATLVVVQLLRVRNTEWVQSEHHKCACDLHSCGKTHDQQEYVDLYTDSNKQRAASGPTEDAETGTVGHYCSFTPNLDNTPRLDMQESEHRSPAPSRKAHRNCPANAILSW
jgi:hypothetical protein